MSFDSADATVTQSFKDRSVGLFFFGLIEIILACLALFFLLGSPFAVQIHNTGSGEPVDMSIIVVAGIVYAIFAVFSLSMGIGSIARKRWARALMTVAAWFWLVSGTLALFDFWFTLPDTLQLLSEGFGRDLIRSDNIEAKSIVMAVVSFFFVLLPLIFLFFYRSNNVKRTCEAYDPVARWTDRCPLPVLATSLGMLLYALLYAIGSIQKPALAILRYVVIGWPGRLLAFALVLIYTFIAVQIYRMKTSVLWGALVLTLFMEMSSLMASWRYPGLESHRLGFSVEQAQTSSSAGQWTLGVFAVLNLIYVLYRRYFANRYIDT